MIDTFDSNQIWDTLVIGGGNAALCAAITAREAGATVLLLECAPKHFRGGNSRHTRNLRYLHESANAFFLGGGKALMNGYYARAEKLGVKIVYDAEVREMEVRNGNFRSASFVSKNVSQRVQAKSVVAIDARAPKYDDGGIVTRLDCVPFGVVVNRHARRFYDEGEDFWPKRYAIWGRLVAKQPDQIAYSIIDSKSIDLFMPSVFTPVEANSIREMAEKLTINPSNLEDTVDAFNQSIRLGQFDSTVLDDCQTKGLSLL